MLRVYRGVNKAAYPSQGIWLTLRKFSFAVYVVRYQFWPFISAVWLTVVSSQIRFVSWVVTCAVHSVWDLRLSVSDSPLTRRWITSFGQPTQWIQSHPDLHTVMCLQHMEECLKMPTWGWQLITCTAENRWEDSAIVVAQAVDLFAVSTK